MFLNVPVLEWLGYLGSVIVAISLTMSSIKKLRWYNLLGATVFTVYGFAIGAMPVGFLNLFIVLADIYYLFKMHSNKESFKVIEVGTKDPYLEYFIDFFKTEIVAFFPMFNKNEFDLNAENCFALLILRNETVAGVVLGVKLENKLKIELDFVTVAYRDLKPGDYIYKTNIQFLKNRGIEVIECSTNNKSHQNYLLRMGFEKRKDTAGVLVKKIDIK